MLQEVGRNSAARIFQAGEATRCPMLAILVVQTIFMALYAIFVTWRMMGKNYD
ncbi:sodium/glutamate symporter family protein, partial [Escherichia coli 95.0083]